MDFTIFMTGFSASIAGCSLTAVGSLIAAMDDSSVAAWALGLTGIGMAGVSIYQRFRQTRRNEDVEDEKALSDSRIKRIHDLSEDVLTARKEAQTANLLAAERLAVIQTLRATCPHRETCPVSQLDRHGLFGSVSAGGEHGQPSSD